MFNIHVQATPDKKERVYKDTENARLKALLFQERNNSFVKHALELSDPPVCYLIEWYIAFTSITCLKLSTVWNRAAINKTANIETSL